MISRRWVRVLLAGVVVLFTGLASVGIASARTVGDLNFVIGQKFFDDDEWGSIDEHDAFGIELTWGNADWPFLIATDIIYSTTDENVLGVDIDGTTIEFDFGVRKIWQRGNARPYIGGGLAYISGEIDFAGSKILDESELGGWVGGGVYWRVGRRFNIGAALRYSSAETDIPGGDLNLGGTTFGLTLGWGWPN